MPINPISTYAALQSTLTDVSKVEANLQAEQTQVSSGNASQDFAGMYQNAQEYLSLDTILARTKQYLDNNKNTEAFVSTTGTVLSQVISTANDLSSLITQRRTGVFTTDAFPEQLQGLYQQLASQLNTAIGGRYLFSGSKTNSPAIDPSAFPQLQQPGVPDAGYYLGNSDSLLAQPQDNTVVTYNITGDSKGFQDIIAAIATARAGHEQNNDALLAKAYDLVQSGLKEVTGLQAKVNANTVLFNTVDTSLTNSKLYFQGIQESIGNTDLVSVSTQVATNQGILQAAFQVYARISTLRLSDYLK